MYAIAPVLNALKLGPIVDGFEPVGVDTTTTRCTIPGWWC